MLTLMKSERYVRTTGQNVSPRNRVYNGRKSRQSGAEIAFYCFGVLHIKLLLCFSYNDLERS